MCFSEPRKTRDGRRATSDERRKNKNCKHCFRFIVGSSGFGRVSGPRNCHGSRLRFRAVPTNQPPNQTNKPRRRRLRVRVRDRVRVPGPGPGLHFIADVLPRYPALAQKQEKKKTLLRLLFPKRSVNKPHQRWSRGL